MSKEVAVFEKQYLTAFQQLADFKKQSELIKKQEETLKEQLLKAMEEYDIKSFKNDLITITYVDASTSIAIDLKALEVEEPDCYAGLLSDYPKTTNKKAYVRFLVK